MDRASSGMSSKRFFTGFDFVGVDLLILPSMDIQLYNISNLVSTRILNAA